MPTPAQHRHQTGLTPQQAAAIWTILTEELGTRGDGDEFRIGGILGFGGKFWRNNTKRPDDTWGEHWYVNYYAEHTTPERDAAVARTNDRLWALRTIPSRTDQTDHADGATDA